MGLLCRVLLLSTLLCSTASVGDYTVPFEGTELRVTEDRPPRLAVRDAVALICRVEAHRAARMRIANELKPFVGSHEFGGSKWHQSPVIAVNELYRLVETLPSECTDHFFSSGQWGEMRFLWGDEWASPASSNEPPPPPPPPYSMIGGGRCLDPETGFDEVCDLCFETSSGRVTAIAPWSRMPAAATPATTCGVPEEMISVVPVRGLVVSPGFISVGSLGGVSFARGRDAVMAGVTALVDAIPGATNVSDWYANRPGAAVHPHHFGVAVAAVDRSGATGGNDASAVEDRLRRGLAEGALAIALDMSATGPVELGGGGGDGGSGVPNGVGVSEVLSRDAELLSRGAVARSYDVAVSTGVSILARGRGRIWGPLGTAIELNSAGMSGANAVEEQRLSTAQEIVANVAATGVLTLCLDTGCFPPARNVSMLAQRQDESLSSSGAHPHLMGEGELRAKSLLELRSFAVELGVESSRIEAARDSEVPPPKEAVLALLIEQQHLLAKERAAQVTAAELAEQRADSGAADAARILTGAASRGLPLKVSGLGGGWDGVHHALTTSGGDNMLAAVEEATLGPAQTLLLGRKGRLQVGLDADITVFDPSATTSMSAIRHVVVNGHFVVRDAAPTKLLPGMPLRHGYGHGDGDFEQQHGSRGQQQQQQQNAAAVEAEQRERLRQRFGAHDGL